ncbi:hypothetical protein SISSUDRAFT_273101 [Sistotremastrum suecicum HHB10207 ss-3]|uniref:Uncharacterized protein n=1 Tax=Sistotremastrum suecicum HHB10207 ss-3 TaxID=1314776 RepID=A0A165ZNB4_9AGAM|nr:hypothetical protein SISSUDRAFT_273101 [Sistotremastrum suecicum HHB10207 ss-3]
MLTGGQLRRGGPRHESIRKWPDFEFDYWFLRRLPASSVPPFRLDFHHLLILISTCIPPLGYHTAGSLVLHRRGLDGVQLNQQFRKRILKQASAPSSLYVVWKYSDRYGHTELYKCFSSFENE